MTSPLSQCTIRLWVNGQEVERTVEVRRSLADFLREDLDLTGTHLGCEHGVCGACTVLLNGEAVRSCLLLAVQSDGAQTRHRRRTGCRRGVTPVAGGLPG